jgi:hypothetical protein
LDLALLAFQAANIASRESPAGDSSTSQHAISKFARARKVKLDPAFRLTVEHEGNGTAPNNQK